jgi:hypothetical protein
LTCPSVSCSFVFSSEEKDSSAKKASSTGSVSGAAFVSDALLLTGDGEETGALFVFAAGVFVVVDVVVVVAVLVGAALFTG